MNESTPADAAHAADAWWDAAPVGLAEVAPDGVLVRLNATGRAILGSAWQLGSPSPFPFDSAGHAVGDAERSVECTVGDGCLAVITYRLGALPSGFVVTFRDVTLQRRQQRHVAAVAATAASVASERSLEVSLGAIAREVAQADGLSGVQILAADRRKDPGLRVMGSAGFPHSEEFFELLMLCRERGASLKMLEAFETGEPVVVRNRYTAVLADPAWGPLHDYLRTPPWSDFASIPLRANHRTVGVLNAFFNPSQHVTDEVLAFLSTMADQASLAIDYAELLERQRQDAGRAERQRLARELHDSVVQQVFSIGMQTEALKLLSNRGGQPSWARVAPVAQELEDITRSVLQDLRGLIAQLHPAPLAANGLSRALTDLVLATQRRSCVQVALDCPTKFDKLPEDLAEDVYFVIAEALHNAVKHAAARSVTITIRRGPQEQLVADVVDDGRGFPATSGEEGGYGLTSMRERAKTWRGELIIGPGDRSGTAVRLLIPAAPNHFSSPIGTLS
ncbi:GAF domain-containing sensor histidine kinase [Microbispora sp. H10836]|uniref:GAF domain-containing sensor histidine kinase n=1 Tax=Microbispora sp. H10836 TaxID=2729106 RepID=UPI001474006F|nr:GAF domain-containing sensor histidine kinase [Microbispora sp. H10836]